MLCPRAGACRVALHGCTYSVPVSMAVCAVCLLQGGRIRVDGSLMGIDDHSPSLVPEWKRGHFSLLYDASGDKARALFVNHTDKKYIDVKGEQRSSEAAVGRGGRTRGSACAHARCRVAVAPIFIVYYNEPLRECGRAMSLATLRLVLQAVE